MAGVAPDPTPTPTPTEETSVLTNLDAFKALAEAAGFEDVDSLNSN